MSFAQESCLPKCSCFLIQLPTAVVEFSLPRSHVKNIVFLEEPGRLRPAAALLHAQGPASIMPESLDAGTTSRQVTTIARTG